MKELKEYFTGIGQVKGYIFNQIKKTDYAYLYEVKDSNRTHYEVFLRKENTMYDCVSYPTDKAFGKWAWTIMDLQKAINKLELITYNEELKEVE